MINSNAKLSGFPEWFVLPETLKVMSALNNNGCEARFVGGCVRDALVNRKSFDVDIAVNLEPAEVLVKLNERGIKSIPTGIDHGTITAVVNGIPFQITSLRKDVETFGRSAKVEFTDNWEEDAKRRDFTINAIYADMEGNLFDYFGGIEDLRLGRIRFVGNAEERVREDYLRILRFFRFYAFFGKGNADREALSACENCAENLKNISAERIGNEILKTLEAENIAAVWQMMNETGVLKVVLPEASNIDGLNKLVSWEKFFENKNSVARRMAVLLEEGVGNIEFKLRLSKNLYKEILLMREDLKIEGEKEIKRLVYKYGNDICRSLVLVSAARNGEGENLKSLYEVATNFRAPRFPVTGNDVMEAGFSEGKEVGQVLSDVENWWMENDFVPKRLECLNRIKEIFLQ